MKYFLLIIPKEIKSPLILFSSCFILMSAHSFSQYFVYQDVDNDMYSSGWSIMSDSPFDPNPVNYYPASHFVNLNQLDCNDNNSEINPGMSEVYGNDIDENCDGLIQHTITATSSPGGEPSPYGVTIVNNGGGQSYTIPPASGSCTSDVSINGVSIGTTTFYNFTNVTSNQTLYVNVTTPIWYLDADGDSYAITQESCTSPGEGWSLIPPSGGSGDCDDADASINPATMWYRDGDLDSYYSDTENSCTSPGPGWSTTIPVGGPNDCNDVNASINPGATEICGNGIDDDCDGSIDEGCPPPANDDPADAQILTFNTYTGMGNPVTGTLSVASNSFQSDASYVTGEDVWYKFVCPSDQTAIQIQVTTSASNIQIVLQQVIGTALDIENLSSSPEGEILNFSGLTPNTTYYIVVQNYNSNQGTGEFLLVANPIQTSNFTILPGYDLNTLAKASYRASATQYKFEFSPDNFATIYSRVMPANLITLSSVLAVPAVNPFNKTYKVRVTAYYTLNNATGTESIGVMQATPGQFSLGAAPTTELLTTDRCSAGQRKLSDLVRAVFQSGAVDYKWQFEEMLDGITPSGTVITKYRGTATNLLQLSSIPQLQAGKTYRVRVAAIYGTAGSDGYIAEYGAWQKVCIAAQAMALLSEENNSIENDDVRMGGNIFSQPLTLYPNPSNGEAITLNIPQIATDNVQLYLMDSSGRQVWQNRYSVDGSMYQTIVFDQQLAAGLYTLGIMYDGKVEVRKMLVRK